MSEGAPTPAAVHIFPVAGLPEVSTGDDLAALLIDALIVSGQSLRDGDVLVVSSKVVSKAAGLRADAAGKAAEVLRQSRRVVAERATPVGVTRIVESVAGPVMAAAGIDASNTGDDGETLLLLPHDPDGAATDLRTSIAAHLARPTLFAVVLSDTAGRPWRIGQTDFALGSSGFAALDDLRGTTDADGRQLAVTARAVADEIASAADLVKGKAHGVAAVVVRGLGQYVVDESPSSAGDLVRTGPGDWFALGHVEAVRSALGVEPGTPDAVQIGLPPVGADDIDARIRRACALALHVPSVEDVAVAAAGHPQGRRFDRLALDQVEADVVQTGIRLTAPDDYTLGLAVSRLCVALTSEGLHGWPTRPSLSRTALTPAGSGQRPGALVVLR